MRRGGALLDLSVEEARTRRADLVRELCAVDMTAPGAVEVLKSLRVELRRLQWLIGDEE